MQRPMKQVPVDFLNGYPVKLGVGKKENRSGGNDIVRDIVDERYFFKGYAVFVGD